MAAVLLPHPRHLPRPEPRSPGRHPARERRAGTQTGGGNARSANTCSRTRDHGEQVLTICLPHED